ncbi:hypothetical protein HYH03_003452 [Edaphochlamys debaryana]|uniref:Uncharacterized protein n=1 Tax=Edaphochlamys debaryana TaxID=47281 RepID=A0A835YBX4_9CHLO|nr:hypothetical protein HYH03_003452 [Edaphochlamys debaryana]|eukprot:KAG2498712.1 hypothetical protein HYH03_003452 [Edaphochlamys debaryana]
MFATVQYSRVYNEDDEEDGAAQRLLREAAAGAPPAVAPAVVASTSSVKGRSAQNVAQRRGGGKPEAGATIAEPAGASGPASGNLIDFGDDADSRPSAPPTKPISRGSRGQAAAPPAVELVSMTPAADPFDLLVQQSAAAPPPPTYSGPGAGAEGRQPAHPLDFGFGAAPSGRPPAAPSASSAFPSLGSFTDLLGALTGTTAASASASASAAGPGPGASSSSSSSQAAALQRGGPLAYGHPGHSQSINGIDDLLQAQRAAREGVQAPAGPGGPGSYQAPGVLHTDRGDPFFDPFGDTPGPGPGHGAASASAASHPHPHAHAHPSGRSLSTGRGLPGPGSRPASTPGEDGAPGPHSARESLPGHGQGQDANGAGAGAGAGVAAGEDHAEPGGGGGAGFDRNQRELLLYALPLFKDRLVFLPVVNWKDEVDTSTVLGKMNAGVASVGTNLSNMWHSLKDKGNMGAKIYKAGQAILENMNAEERLMRNIPKKANKLVVHHPASVPPDEIQDQLTALTSTFCYKSAGKAAVAGVMLPVAVGLEVIAVPGIGWYTAYQLFKSTSAAAGGSRLNQYLKGDRAEVRINYAPQPKMDLYILKSRLAPDGVLGSEDIEDLVHDLREPALAHPLQELRARFLKKTQTTNADYALLPMTSPDQDEAFSSAGSGQQPAKKKD